MTDSLDENAYTRAIQPMNFASAEQKPGGHSWARELVQRYCDHNVPQKDDHLARMVQHVRAYLQDNQPVMAYQWINKIGKHLEERGLI